MEVWGIVLSVIGLIFSIILIILGIIMWVRFWYISKYVLEELEIRKTMRDIEDENRASKSQKRESNQELETKNI